MRGNPGAWRLAAFHDRSIPAYAGEPLHTGKVMPLKKVYPRVCGGTGRKVSIGTRAEGLSPRMRGNRRMIPARFRITRSIPAYAGEPGGGYIASYQSRVYPRVCGGTGGGSEPPPAIAGLSPRMRGNPNHTLGNQAAVWSIPAYAGEPKARGAEPTAPAVYPRVCGGTSMTPSTTASVRGLSPRMRGNL